MCGLVAAKEGETREAAARADTSLLTLARSTASNTGGAVGAVAVRARALFKSLHRETSSSRAAILGPSSARGESPDGGRDRAAGVGV